MSARKVHLSITTNAGHIKGSEALCWVGGGRTVLGTHDATEVTCATCRHGRRNPTRP